MDFKESLKPIYYTNNNSTQKTMSEKTDLEFLLAKLGKQFPHFLFSEYSTVAKHSNKTKDYIQCRLLEGDYLPFSIPIPPLEDTPIYSHPKFEEIKSLSEKYEIDSTYFNLLVNECIQQHTYLREKFPEVFFKTKMRIKAPLSIVDKLNNILEYNKIHPDDPKSLSPHDIFAFKHIISSVKDTNDENVLELYCNKFMNALREYYETKEEAPLLIFGEKNYIKAPKANGYKSIHLNFNKKNDPLCKCEAQIRTLSMELNSRSGPWSHNSYKPRFFNQYSENYVPLYMEVSSDKNRYDEYEYFSLSPDSAFRHYYGVSIQKYKESLRIFQPIISEIQNYFFQKKETRIINLDNYRN